MEKSIPLLEGERIDRINEDLSLIQKKDGLTFGTDAYLLGAFVRSSGGTAVELGSGTGVVSLLCARQNKASKIYAAEIQPEFAELCERNAVMNGLENSVISLLRDVRELTVGDTGGEVDFVMSNPPYMSKDAGKGNDHDAKNIARREICGNIVDFCSAASRLLKYGGDFYTVYRPERLGELISALRENALEPKILVTVYPREDAPPCLVLVKSRKHGRPGLIMTPPLIIYRRKEDPAGYPIPEGEKDLGYTDAFARIYGEFSLDHLIQKGTV